MSDEWNEFDVRLRTAMQRVEAPDTLLRSVMAAVQSEQKPTWRERFQLFVMPRTRAWATGAMAALLALVALGGEQWQQHRERELATQQFEAASRITDKAMEHTRQQLQSAGIPLE
jgi:hypothetical protein